MRKPLLAKKKGRKGKNPNKLNVLLNTIFLLILEKLGSIGQGGAAYKCKGAIVH